MSLPATHERHVIQLVPNVQVQDYKVAKFVITGGICSLTLLLVLNPAHHPTTRLAATRVNHVIQPVKNVIVLHILIAQHVRKVITCTEILVLQIAQHFSTQSEEYVITAMKTVKNVLSTQQTNVRLVRRVTIFMM